MILNYFYHAAIPLERIIIFKDMTLLLRMWFFFLRRKILKLVVLKHGLSLQSVINQSRALSMIHHLLLHVPNLHVIRHFYQ